MSDSIEMQVQRLNAQVSALQAFLVKNTEATSTIPGFVNGLSAESGAQAKITFWNSNKADVARWFGADGWSKKQHALGIDYVKELDGVQVVINEAEQLKPTAAPVSPAELL